MRQANRFLLLACVAVSVLLAPIRAGAADSSNAPAALDQGAAWPTAAPEELGVDSRDLLRMFQTIRAESRNIHSVLIARHGRLLVEAYFAPYRRDLKHIIYSATKSVSSLLIGIALKEGLLPSIDAPILDVFPEYRGRDAAQDGRKDLLTLRHILTMTDGLDWTDGPYRITAPGDFLSLLSSRDGVGYYLSKPMRETPGTRFSYNSGSSYMLSAVIQRVAGKDILEYGREKLFTPLGITDVGWGTYSGGIRNGGSELFLRPRDFARIGGLVLNRGTWAGREIVPESWIEDISRPHVKSDVLDYGYSYQWFIDRTLPQKSVSAQGLGAQYLFVIPGAEMVAVFTAGMIGRDELDIPFYYLRDFILPSIRSAGSLPPNPATAAKLRALLQEFENPEPKPIPPLPPRALEISDVTFAVSEKDIAKNPWGLEAVALHFPREGPCRIRLAFAAFLEPFSLNFDAVFRSTPGAPRRRVLDAVCGLDGQFSTVLVETDSGALPYSARGRWLDAKTFEATVLSGWSLPEVHTFRFPDDGSLDYSCRTIFYGFSLSGRARPAGSS